MEPNKDKLVFQQIDVDNYVGPVMPGMPGPMTGSAPVVRLYGNTMDGHSVICHVHGFLPYFHSTVPDAFDQSHVTPFKVSKASSSL